MVVEGVVRRLHGPQFRGVSGREFMDVEIPASVGFQEDDVPEAQAGLALEEDEGLVEVLHHHHQVQLPVQLLHVLLHSCRVPGEGHGKARVEGQRNVPLIVPAYRLQPSNQPRHLLVLRVVHVRLFQIFDVVSGGEEQVLRLPHDGQVEGVAGHDAVECRTIVDHVVEEEVKVLASGKRHDALLPERAEAMENI